MYGYLRPALRASAWLSLSYDKENRLTLHLDGTTRTTYTYQPDGLKWSEVSGATSTTLVWDGDAYLGTA